MTRQEVCAAELRANKAMRFHHDFCCAYERMPSQLLELWKLPGFEARVRDRQGPPVEMIHNFKYCETRNV